MNVIVVIVGWLIILTGLFGIASPHSLIDMILAWSSTTRFYFTVIVRIVFGVIFIFAALRCRVPWLIYVIGTLALLAGIVLFFLGAARVDETVNWFAARSDLCIRLTYVVTTLFGVLLVYAGSKRHQFSNIDRTN
jgi:hypothetical protein